MFSKKNKSENKNSYQPTNSSPKNTNSLHSWITGKVGSFIFFSAAGYALHKFGIIKQITNYLTKQDKGKNKVPLN